MVSQVDNNYKKIFSQSKCVQINETGKLYM